jgi:hypothetical protein
VSRNDGTTTPDAPAAPVSQVPVTTQCFHLIVDRHLSMLSEGTRQQGSCRFDAPSFV